MTNYLPILPLFSIHINKLVLSDFFIVDSIFILLTMHIVNNISNATNGNQPMKNKNVAKNESSRK